MNIKEISEMHPNGANVAAALAKHGVTGRIIETIDSSPTAATAAAQLDIEVGQVANSLIFSADGEPVLVLTSGQHKADTKLLATHLGVSEVTRPDADFVRKHTTQPIGGVAPVGHPVALRTIVDTQLNAWDTVWAAGGHPHYVFPTSYAELLKITNGEPLDVGVKK
jgi:prolyl-tRNA editing enzyme YbaK/EbsC (Cys-tRNA(Pro) deacylase)